MVKKFKYYFYPFLYNLSQREDCRLYDLSRYISNDLMLTSDDLSEFTKSGRLTKHSSRVNYCASYLKKMGLVESFSVGSYKITEYGRQILEKYGDSLTLDTLRELPEFFSTQVNISNTDLVYVKTHKRGSKIIRPYLCKKNALSSVNPNIEHSFFEKYRNPDTKNNTE